jgi:hypothetical protein
MNPYLRNFLAVAAGILAGGIVNGAIVSMGSAPEGVDPNDMLSIKAGMEAGLYEPKHFLIPFVAHAIGTLVGAMVTARFVTKAHMFFGFIIGVLFLLMGVLMVFMVGGPLWFIALDLGVAYIPMAIIGARIVRRKK